MIKKKSITQLHREVSKLQDEIYTRENVKIQKENQKLVGKFFKTKNCYDRDGEWFLYCKVISLAENRGFNIVSFEKTIDDRFDIRKYHYYNLDSWEEITENEYKTASINLRAELSVLLS